MNTLSTKIITDFFLLEEERKCSISIRNQRLASIHSSLDMLRYDTGASVQELIDIKVCDVILDSPAVIVLNGKGQKETPQT